MRLFISYTWGVLLFLTHSCLAVPLLQLLDKDTGQGSQHVKSASLVEETIPEMKSFHLVEYDILLDEEQYKYLAVSDDHRQKRKAIRSTFYHWPNAEMPYQIHPSIDTEHAQGRQRIRKAMAHWEKHTCIKFVEYDARKHRNYVSIRKGQWCASKLGMTGGAQPLFLAAGCMDTGTIVHELGHTLGWVHEQARPDRDEHVEIDWQKIPASYKGQYTKHGNDYVNTYGIPYDYGSIMHYPSYGEIITRNKSAQGDIGQRVKLSFLDIKLANVMYKCAARNHCNTYKTKCRSEGYMNSECRCVCPVGGHRSCIAGDSSKPRHQTAVSATPTPACLPWNTYDNAYIPGNNDDVGFGLTVEQCKERCMQETSFNCQSFDYWKQRRQCYLSAASAKSLGIRFARDARMIHYERHDCPLTRPTTTTKQVVDVDGPIGDQTPKPANLVTTSSKKRTTAQPSNVRNRLLRTTIATPGDGASTDKVTTPASTTAPHTKKTGPTESWLVRYKNRPSPSTTVKPTLSKPGDKCPWEYAYISHQCVQPFAHPQRSVHIARIECKQRLDGNLWQFKKHLLGDEKLSSLVGEGEEYWVDIKGFKSTNIISDYFDFCPYITKKNGQTLIKDAMCVLPKPFFCQIDLI